MTAPRGRPPGQGKAPGSGRKRGGLDKSARLLITETMAADILKTYKRLGKDWLFEVAKTRPDLFINQCLSRLLPPAFKDGDEQPGIQINQQFNSGLPDFEAARRVAFALAAGVYGDPSRIDRTAEHDPVATVPPPVTYTNPNEIWKPPTDAPDMPAPDPARQLWASELSLTDDQRRDNALVRQTKQVTLETYAGSPEEQGLGPARHSSTAQTKSSAGELARRLSRRGRSLL